MDSHKDTLAVSGVDAAGRQQQAQVVPNTRHGHCRLLGWLPSQFLSAAPKPNAPSSSPSGWAASGTGETPSSAGPFLSKGDFVTEPRDLTDLVPADVRTELAAAVAALELHGPAVTKALQRLDRATTAAWLVQRRR
jgi:hypothetical protein